jgi:hypothetical protein
MMTIHPKLYTQQDWWHHLNNWFSKPSQQEQPTIAQPPAQEPLAIPHLIKQTDTDSDKKVLKFFFENTPFCVKFFENNPTSLEIHRLNHDDTEQKEIKYFDLFPGLEDAARTAIETYNKEQIAYKKEQETAEKQKQYERNVQKKQLEEYNEANFLQKIYLYFKYGWHKQSYTINK